MEFRILNAEHRIFILLGKKNKKLKVDADAAPSSLNDAFSSLGSLDSLDLSALPAGPEHIEPASTAAKPAAVQNGKRGEVIQRRETAHRGGKSVIIVAGLAALESEDTITELAARLKKRCGCGGTVKNGEIIIQGEKAPEVADFLRMEGFRVRGVTQ